MKDHVSKLRKVFEEHKHDTPEAYIRAFYLDDDLRSEFSIEILLPQMMIGGDGNVHSVIFSALIRPYAENVEWFIQAEWTNGEERNFIRGLDVNEIECVTPEGWNQDGEQVNAD